MKKFLMLLCFSLLGLITFSQLPSFSNATEKYLLQKSLRQKTKAPIYFSVGAMAIAGGLSMYTSSTNLDDAVYGLGMSIMGGVCFVTGGLLFRSSAIHKKRALQIAVGKQTIMIPFEPLNFVSTQSAIILRCRLNK